MSQLLRFTLKDIDGNNFNFEQLKNKVVLIVNTASKCGFTPQFEGLQRLYEKFRDKDFIVLGIPSNDFLFQEPGINSEIKNFCQMNYGVDFPMFEKLHVRGRKIHPLYKYLIQGDGIKKFEGKIKWNFTKFLIDRNGLIVGRFESATKPDGFEESILQIL